MNPEEFYREGMRPERAGWLVRPVRRLLYRLLRPYLLILLHHANLASAERQLRGDRESAALAETSERVRTLDAQRRILDESVAELSTHVGLLDERVEAVIERRLSLEERLKQLEAKIGSISALAWDREAVVRRLATLEDLLERQLPKPDGSLQPNDSSASAKAEPGLGGGE